MRLKIASIILGNSSRLNKHLSIVHGTTVLESFTLNRVITKQEINFVLKKCVAPYFTHTKYSCIPKNIR